ncbi:MAG: nucleoside deaminase [Candidatus Marinimicrobia bacterium]|jgi:tRNA(adenine34) deaminase|nr:nucleoside deaminase [Candidatus Neomarinimicrobiota bacterium]MBT4149562.1 nucleoside deaminase [Candidatus Neomarinimicrobiota bacterium]MBT4784487.1 nucleoside deaminase [Candidatus Neomarinimicrobiota bacterium]MBT7525158.1 nucleoside deaminase [Candidatus Neomarinimicrobiota bacterium]
MKQDNEYWMKQALIQADKALQLKEVPVGAIIVKDNKVIGRGYNQKEQLNDPTAHAEIVAITAAANTLEDWRLNDCVLYVTKEPCSMCAGAILNARLKLVVFGCYDEEEGCCGSLYQLCGDPRFKTKVSVMGGVMESQSLSLIKDFFIKSRKKV